MTETVITCHSPLGDRGHGLGGSASPGSAGLEPSEPSAGQGQSKRGSNGKEGDSQGLADRALDWQAGEHWVIGEWRRGLEVTVWLQ